MHCIYLFIYFIYYKIVHEVQDRQRNGQSKHIKRVI